jgi:hypothetical protein
MIIAHLIYDMSSLRACSLTCHSWYTASVSHLHHTLIIQSRWWGHESKLVWPNPLQNASELGLLPLVKTLRLLGIHSRCPEFSSKQFNPRILRQFLVLTNVRELMIDNLDIPSFMPMVQRYFGHFSPTVRTLTLKNPIGSSRQILYFIGLFEHLENLTLKAGIRDSEGRQLADDLTLVPLFTPPLRGLLVIDTPARVGFLEDMSRVFGGIQFHHKGLFDVDKTPIPLGLARGD